MYCKNCKKYIGNVSKTYCDNCGAYLGSTLATTSANLTSDNIPRSDIISYLYIVKSLECVKGEITKRIEANENLLSIYRGQVNLPEVDKVEDFDKSKLLGSLFLRIKWFDLLLSLGYGVATFVVLMICYLIFGLILIIFSSDEYTFVDSDLFGNTLLFIIIALSVGIAFIGCVDTLLLAPVREIEEDMKKHQQHQQAQQEYSKKVAIRTAKKRQIERENAIKAQKVEAELQKDRVALKNITQQLTNAYSLNLIPKQFRNLAALAYIYDFMASSRETLKSALLHMKLDTITQYLEKINRQQLANEAISRAIQANLSQMNYRQDQIQRTIHQSNMILKDIHPFFID